MIVHNAFIKYYSDLSAVELKILYILYKFRKKQIIELNHLCYLLHVEKNYLRKKLSALASKGYLRYSFCSDSIRYKLQRDCVSKHYTHVDLWKILRLKSKHSIQMYILLARHSTNKRLDAKYFRPIEVTSFEKMFGYIGKHIYTLLSRVQEDLKNVGIYITYTVKRGKIRIAVQHQVQHPKQKQQQPQEQQRGQVINANFERREGVERREGDMKSVQDILSSMSLGG